MSCFRCAAQISSKWTKPTTKSRAHSNIHNEDQVMCRIESCHICLNGHILFWKNDNFTYRLFLFYVISSFWSRDLHWWVILADRFDICAFASDRCKHSSYRKIKVNKNNQRSNVNRNRYNINYSHSTAQHSPHICTQHMVNTQREWQERDSVFSAFNSKVLCNQRKKQFECYQNATVWLQYYAIPS